MSAGGTGTAVGIAGSTLQAAGQIYAGYSSYKSALGEASLMEEQGLLTRNDYFRQAALVKDEGERLRSKQTMEYISAGVEAVGTPLLVLRETLSRAYARGRSYETTGINSQILAQKKAKILRSEGKAALISGVLQGAGTMLSGAGTAMSSAGKGGTK